MDPSVPATIAQVFATLLVALVFSASFGIPQKPKTVALHRLFIVLIWLRWLSAGALVFALAALLWQLIYPPESIAWFWVTMWLIVGGVPAAASLVLSITLWHVERETAGNRVLAREMKRQGD